MIPFRKKYAPGSCEYRSGYKEIRWDVVGCNLKCQFCWSPASRPEETNELTVMKSADEVFSDTKKLFENGDFKPSDTFIRFTGGEPTLYWENLSKVFNIFEKDADIGSVPILIQTNGIEIGKGNVTLDDLESRVRQLYLFELSFKGTNKEEFSILTGRSPKLYDYQLEAYDILTDISRRNHNVCVIAVLGVYHSSVKNKSKYVFVNPDTENILFDNVETWDVRFKKIWNSAKLKWVEPLRMSPKGVWESLYKRCGPQGSGILRYYPNGVRTNGNNVFPMKPKSYEYASLIVNKIFWKDNT